jgi:hypothetical protein
VISHYIILAKGCIYKIKIRKLEVNKIEYKAMKKMAKAQFGADDAESLIYFSETIEKKARIFKWPSIILGIIAIPLCLVIIGIPLLIMAVVAYFVFYKRIANKAQRFREHVNNDPELSAA